MSGNLNRPMLSPLLIEKAVREALEEDLGLAGDITSNATIPEDAQASAVISSRENGIVCGLDLARCAFDMLDSELSFVKIKDDMDPIKPGQVIAEIQGNARAILAAERVALNFLMRMSGIASYTSSFANLISHTNAKVCCTRKTVPGMRAFDKYAVKIGGGSNHRFRLDDAILIKDNHIAICGGVGMAINKARAYAGHLVKVEVEVDTIHQFKEALAASPDVVLLDNMSLEQLREAVAIRKNTNATSVKLEASGNVSIDTVKDIAQTGVDYISTSKITMAAPTLDVGLDIKI